jgi:demethylmenaquinone methyltransferase/2-methoxy-6-polyprenyl-1,4-benzoquinol methylase
MFDRIAHRYDFLNHFLSLNRDVAWRRKMAAALPDGDALEVLDLATGTGDQLIALHQSGRVKSGAGIDLAEKMDRRSEDRPAAFG